MMTDDELKTAAAARQQSSEETIFIRIADGLDACVTEGRGWDASHEEAKRLADAAPAMLKALRALYREAIGDGESLKAMTPAMREAKDAITLADKGETA